MSTDIADVDGIDSIVRRVLAERGILSLTDFPIATYVIPPEFKVVEQQFPADGYAKEIRAMIEPIVEEAEELGYEHSLFTALYEAVLNAHQHGNKFTPEKK